MSRQLAAAQCFPGSSSSNWVGPQVRKQMPQQLQARQFCAEILAAELGSKPNWGGKQKPNVKASLPQVLPEERNT